jgi:hypothetical protein
MTQPASSTPSRRVSHPAHAPLFLLPAWRGRVVRWLGLGGRIGWFGGMLGRSEGLGEGGAVARGVHSRLTFLDKVQWMRAVLF